MVAGNGRFWELADALVAGGEVVIDRPRGSRHPRLAEVVYPLNYGYLAGTAAADGGGVDVWLGSLPDRRVTAAIVTVDVFKRDAELKLLLGCTAAEARLALATHDQRSQAGLLLERLPSDDPADR